MNPYPALGLSILISLLVQLAHASETDTAGECIHNICFDSEELSYLVAPEGVRNRFLDHEPEGELNGRILHQRADFNGDGITDIGVFELKGEDLKKLHSSYEVYFGTLNESGVVHFPSESSTAVHSEGIPFDLIVEDLNDDGLTDVAIMVINPGFMKVVGMLFSSVFTDAISLELGIYAMADSTFPEKPTTVRKVRTISLGKSGEQAATYPEITFSDVNDDGHTDLLVETGHERYDLYPAMAGEQLFETRPIEFRKAIAQE